MKHFLFLTLLFLSLLTACQKETNIEGIVLNKKTGNPIKGAHVDLVYSYGDGRANTFQGGGFFTTGKDGRFSHYHSSRIWDARFREIRANGYAPQFGLSVEENKCSEPVFELEPMDSKLQIEVENVSGTHDSIWVHILNKCEFLDRWSPGTHSFKTFPLSLGIGEKYTESLPTCRNNVTIVKWAFEAISNTPMTDTLFISAADIVNYSIKY